MSTTETSPDVLRRLSDLEKRIEKFEAGMTQIKDVLLEKLETMSKEMTAGQTRIALDVAALKVRAGMWGGLSVVIAAVAIALVTLLRHSN